MTMADRYPVLVSGDSLQSLLDERQSLLDKKFDGTMTFTEQARLAWIRWQLDRLEAARDSKRTAEPT
jgi:hypothetical protein